MRIPSPRGVLGAPAGRAALCLALLAATTAQNLTRSAPVALAALIVAGLVIAPGLKRSAASATGRFAMAQALAAALLLGIAGRLDEAMVLAGMRFSGVASFLICMPLYARLFATTGLDRALIRGLGRLSPPRRIPVLLAGAVGSAAALSFGTIPMLGQALPRRCPPVAAALARGVVISMLLAPTTGSVAAVMAVFPDLGPAAMLGATLPLAAIAFALACALGGEPLPLPAGDDRPLRLQPWPIVAAVATIVALVWIGMPLLAAIAWGGIAVSGAVAMVGEPRRELPEVAGVLSATAHRLAPEILLFIATGWLGAAVAATIPPLSETTAWAATARPAIPLAVMAAMAGLAALGIHPMVVFGALQPAVATLGTGLPAAGEYAMWVMAFVLALLVAPVSVLTAFTAATSGLGAWQVSARLQSGYALALAAATALYLAVRF